MAIGKSSLEKRGEKEWLDICNLRRSPRKRSRELNPERRGILKTGLRALVCRNKGFLTAVTSPTSSCWDAVLFLK